MMTREEAIAVLEESKRQNEIMRDNPITFWASHQMAEGVKNAKRRIEAFEIALSALRPVSREQVEKVLRGEWGRYCFSDDSHGYQCKNCGVQLDDPVYYRSFCPKCGKAMTGEAVEMVMERMEALHDTEN